MVSQVAGITEETGTSRLAILDAATEVFMESGFSGSRVDEIARRAAANKAMIYYHFRSKKGLYQAVLQRLFGNVLLEVARLRQSGMPPDQKLRALYTRVVRHFTEQRALPHVILREILAGGRGMDAETTRTLGTILAFVSDTLAEGHRAGLFRRVHPLLFHLTMLAPLMVHFAGASFRERLLPREMPSLAQPSNEDMLTHLLQVLESSLAPAPPARPAATLRKSKTRRSKQGTTP